VEVNNQGETTMTNLDPQTTADFWDAYVTAAGAGAPAITAPGDFRTKTSRSSKFWRGCEEM
jgi:hypothetical protein